MREIDPVYYARFMAMYDKALTLKEGDVEAAIRLLSTTADKIALGGNRNRPARAVVRQALSLEARRG